MFSLHVWRKIKFNLTYLNNNNTQFNNNWFTEPTCDRSEKREYLSTFFLQVRVTEKQLAQVELNKYFPKTERTL